MTNKEIVLLKLFLLFFLNVTPRKSFYNCVSEFLRKFFRQVFYMLFLIVVYIIVVTCVIFSNTYLFVHSVKNFLKRLPI